MNGISDLFKLTRMSRDEATKFIRENPDEVFDLLEFLAKRIVNRVVAKCRIAK